jgi:predicted dehydrogenase
VPTSRIGIGIVGAGFVGPHHLDALRRLGVVDIVALATSSEESARRKADALHVPRAYGRVEALLDDPDVAVVHVATPNHLHAAVITAALARGKHVVSDKPLTTTVAEADRLVEQATRAGVVHAVTFNYRGNPLVQEARALVARGAIGVPHFVHGQYLQDWLIEPTDYSWRLDSEYGGASSAFGDIGSHWCDLAEHVTGLRIKEVLAAFTTVVRRRHRPTRAREAFEAAGSSPSELVDVPVVDVRVEDLASVLLRFDNGATGSVAVGQVCAGHKNDLALEVCGGSGSVRWQQERQNELWIGRRHAPNQLLQKDPSLLGPEASGYARLPGGHQEGWSDAFFNVIKDIYTFIASGARPSDPHPPAMATFADGARAVRIVDAAVRSARGGGVWVRV